MIELAAGAIIAPNGGIALAAEDPVVEVLSEDAVDDVGDDGHALELELEGGADGCKIDAEGDGQGGDDRRQRVLELAPKVLGQVLRSTGHLAIVLQFIKRHRLYESKYRSMRAYASEELNLEPHVLRVGLRAGRVAWDVFPSDAENILDGLLRNAPLGSIAPLLNQTKLVALGKALRAAPAECRAEIIEQTVSGRCSVQDLAVWAKRGRSPSTVRDDDSSCASTAPSPKVSHEPVGLPDTRQSSQSATSERAEPLLHRAREGEEAPARAPLLCTETPPLPKDVPLVVSVAFASMMAVTTAFENEDFSDEVRDYAKLLCDRLAAAVARRR